jgi:3-hydroxybutyryl-CoA dehydratase
MNALPEANDIRGYYFKDLSVGMTDSYAKAINKTNSVLFAGISGHVNPIQLNEEFPTETMLEVSIAHDMLTTSFISTVLGTELPGHGCIYLRQDLHFFTPVRPSDPVHSQITITDVNAKKIRVYADTVCRVGETSVVEEEASLFVPNRRKADAA